MAIRMPDKESELLAYARNFSAVLSASYETYGCSASQAENLADRLADYAVALTAALAPSTRTSAQVADKNSAKAALKSTLRRLAKIAHAAENVSEAQLINIGLSARARPSQIDAPADPPKLTVRATLGRTLKIQLRPRGTKRRARPDDAAGAAIFTYQGAAAPVSLAEYTYYGNTSKTRCDVHFPATTPAGSQVFLVAQWYSRRGQFGPPCDPEAAYLGGGVVLMPLAA